LAAKNAICRLTNHEFAGFLNEAPAPEKYAAQYDGHCAMGAAYENGHKDTVGPEAFPIVNGKLRVNHTKYWTTEWRKNESENISRADKNWCLVKDTSEPTK
jgi:hypothetical protein